MKQLRGEFVHAYADDIPFAVLMRAIEKAHADAYGVIEQILYRMLAKEAAFGLAGRQVFLKARGELRSLFQ